MFGNYGEVLGSTLVATSTPFGWRTEPVLTDALDPGTKTFYAMTERTVLVGYEALVGAVSVVGG